MKFFIYIALAVLSIGPTYAQDVILKDYSWKLTDIADRGFTKETFFNQIDRSFVKIGASICSNRALLWANDFKRLHDIDSAKIFLFYTKITGEVGRKTWWYHVAPIVNEKGQQWVMDAGFPDKISGPQTKADWLKSFISNTNCKEIKSGEDELIENMFKERVFPQRTPYGKYDCYYRIAPGPYWTPAAVAKNLLGQNEFGQPIQFERNEIQPQEVYEACVEATTSKLGRVLGGNVKECKALVGIEG